MDILGKIVQVVVGSGLLVGQWDLIGNCSGRLLVVVVVGD